MRPGRDAAHAIAALAGGRTVGVPDPVIESARGIARAFHAQQLVETHAGMAVAQRPDLPDLQRKFPPPTIQHDEVVAAAVHLGKAQRRRTHFHDWPAAGMAPWAAGTAGARELATGTGPARRNTRRTLLPQPASRAEERRVGKECR